MIVAGRALIVSLCLLAGGCAVLDAVSVDRREPTLASLKGREVALDADQEIVAGREKAAATYREALAASTNPRMEAEALRRLADLQLEFAEESLLDTDAMPVGTEFDDAISLYESLLARHPDNPGNDRVLYQLARAQESAGRPADALLTLDELTSAFPSSRYFFEAQFRRGEMLFLARRFDAAESAYAEISKAGGSNPFYAPALYKQGWAMFKQSMHQESLTSFLDLLDHKLVTNDTLRVTDSLGKAERELVDDTLRAVSISLSYFLNSREVDDWLAKRNPLYMALVYGSLADLYVSQERYADAAESLNAFVKARPLDAEAPGFQLRVIETWRAGKFPSRELAARDMFVTRYAPGADYWRANSPDEHADVLTHVERHLGELARHHHARYQELAGSNEHQAERATAATRAVDYYSRTLESFPASESAPESAFLMGELLFESRRFQSAVEAYERAAFDYADFDKRAEAGYAALLAYKEHEALLRDAELAAWQLRATQSALRFADTFPAHPEANAVLLKVAEASFAEGDLDQATELAGRVLSAQPAPAAALRVNALVVTAHARFDQEQFSAAEQAYVSALAVLSESDPRHAGLRDKKAASIYKQGEQARDSGMFEVAAQAFGRVAAALPGSGMAAIAEYDAADMWLRLENWQAAAQILDAFVTDHPDHELTIDAHRRLVGARQEGGDSVGAARALLAISTSSDDLDEQENALWQAAGLLAKSGESVQAVMALEDYVKRFGARFETAMEARAMLAELHAEDGNHKEVKRWEEAIVKAHKASGAQATPRTKTLAARAAMRLALPSVAEYQAAQLNAPLKAALKTKKRRMEKALTALTEAADFGIQEVTTRATFEIADVYGHMGEALLASARPRSLSPEELEQYEMLLEEQAFPFEEKAIELHEANVARVGAGVFDEWVQASLSALATLVPARYAKIETSEEAIAQIH